MRYLALLMFTVALQNIFAYNIQGRVLDKETLEPLEDAVILALSDNKVLSSVESNSKGEFKLTLKVGKFIRLEVVKLGYKTENAELEITKEFIEAKPTITIHLLSKNIQNTYTVNKVEEEIFMEDIGALEDLPAGYKIIEAVPIKEKETKSSGFNVREEVSDQTTNVNVDVLKTEYNKKTESESLIPNHNFTTSYYQNGNIFYNVAKAFLSKSVQERLKDVAMKIKNDPTVLLKLTVFADANKEAKIGEYISKMRVEEVVNFFIKEGVNFEQLDINIIGNQMVKNDCNEGVDCTEEQHQENRKIELDFSTKE